MMNNKSVHQAEKLTDAELSKKLGRYQFIEALLSLLVIAPVIAGIIALIFRNIAAAGILIFAGIAIGVILVGGIQKRKKAFLQLQMGDFFAEEFEKKFGNETDDASLKIERRLLNEAGLIGCSFEQCDIENYHCGRHRGIEFSAADAVLIHSYDELPGREESMIRTETVFDGVVILCKTKAPHSARITVNEREGERPAGDIADPAVFDACFTVNAENKYDIPAYITQAFREMIKDSEKAVGGACCGAALQNGILGIAINTKYVFAGKPRNFDMSDIDGMRKYYVSSLERMGSLLDIIEKNPSFFGDRAL